MSIDRNEGVGDPLKLEGGVGGSTTIAGKAALL